MKTGRMLVLFVALLVAFGALPFGANAAPPPEPVIWIDAGWSEQADVDAAFAAGAVPEGVVWGSNAFNSLPTAINRLESGGTIYIFSGTYDATVVNGTTILEILKPMTLQGLDAAGEYIEDCDHPGMPEIHAIAESLGGFSFWVGADNVSFIGLKFVPYGTYYGGDLVDDYVTAECVIHVTGTNFFMEHCSVVAPELRESAESNSNLASLLFDTEGAVSATVRHNFLIGGVQLWDGAGSGGITIEDNAVWVCSYATGIGVENAHPPVVARNEFEWDGNAIALWTYASEENEHPGAEWFFTVLESNYFTEAYLIITDLETLALKEIPARSSFIYAYGRFAQAAEHAEAEEAIVVFHPSSADGITFDSSRMVDGTDIAIPTLEGGVVVFIPKSSLPGDGIYTVTVVPAGAPADLPTGYLLIGGADFTIAEGDVAFSEFADDIVMWFHYPADADPSTLAVFWYDPVAEAWVELEFEVDAANNRLIVTVDHWSHFALMDATGLPATGTAVMWLIPFGALLLLAGWGLRRRAVA